MANEMTETLDVPSHAETMKFTDKIEPSESTGERAATQLLLRRYTTNIVFRSPVMASIRSY